MSWKLFQKLLYVEQFLLKGWEIGILLLLPILLLKGQINLFELGVLSTALSLSQFGLSTISGYVVQKLGNKKTMVISAIMATLPWIMLTISQRFEVMLAAYIVEGASSGLYETYAIALNANNLKKGQRSEGMANFGMMGDLGRILFTGVTTMSVVTIGFVNFYLINSLVGIIMFTGILIILTKNQLSINLEVDFTSRSSHIPSYFKNKQLLLAIVAGCLDSFSSASLFIFLPLLFAKKGLPYEESGFLSILLFVGYLLGRKGLGKLADKFGTVKTLMIGETFMVFVLLGIVVANNFGVLIILLILLGVAARGTSPVCKALVADSLPDDLTIETGMAVYISSARLASIISRPVFSTVAGLAGISWVFGLSAISALMINVPLAKSERE